jgi:predicted Zn-dependent protease
MRARLNADKDLPYPAEITVLDHELVNAFALPGGRVVVFRGLLEAAENPNEVAAVLAHELGHVVNRDPTRDALRLAGSIGVLGLMFGDFAGGTVVLVLANELINASYSQRAEAGADDYAHHLLTEADLPPAALGTFFTRLKDQYGDAEGIAAHFSTHPQMTARIEAAMAAQEEAERVGHTGAPALDDRQWQALRSICGPAPGGGKGGDAPTDARDEIGGKKH